MEKALHEQVAVIEIDNFRLHHVLEEIRAIISEREPVGHKLSGPVDDQLARIAYAVASYPVRRVVLGSCEE